MMVRVLMTGVAAAALAGAAMVGPAAAQNGSLDTVGAGPTRNIGGLSAENDAAFRHDMRISGGEGRDRILGSPSFGGRRFAARGFVGRDDYARNWGDNWRWRRFGRRDGWSGFGSGLAWEWGSPNYAHYDYGHPAYASYGYGGCTCGGPYASVRWRRPYASVSRGW